VPPSWLLAAQLVIQSCLAVAGLVTVFVVSDAAFGVPVAGSPLMPGALRAISNCTPVGAAAEGLQDSVRGQFPPAAPLLVLAGYALAFGMLAWRYFRWE
jgi:hypothetical protein